VVRGEWKTCKRIRLVETSSHTMKPVTPSRVLGVPFTEVRIVPGEDGKIGVPLKTNPWTGPRPASNPGEFTDEEWAELSRSYDEWERGRREITTATPFCTASTRSCTLWGKGVARWNEKEGSGSIKSCRV